ncbi:unnamed protein product [Ceutorhynchus assimilis]|uniref:Laminin EGF-like domain-containing protein n=1 Tax=Ceutorhynchus assimilis TaxID=467358 RepID=A0A9N9MXM6_9CUCU|nr:unnamed protein product [Ceutorhynchus assimilis]
MRGDGSCVACQCDETGSMFQQCNAEGKCQSKAGVSGDKCYKCAENHYNFTKSDCKNCECSEEGSVFNAPNCNPNNGVCNCKENVEGKQCKGCKPGFFNLDLERIRLHSLLLLREIVTLQLRCGHNTGRSSCDICLQGYYGNALVLPEDDCKRCECYLVGTEADTLEEPIYDSSIGACVCKNKVVGMNCDQCEDGFYNMQSGEGCHSCNCDPIGSYNSTCNLYSGQCYCGPGVTGLRSCYHCDARKYGFSLEGCEDCECDVIGSNDLKCNAPGQCPCLDNVEGRRCNRQREKEITRTLATVTEYIVEIEARTDDAQRIGDNINIVLETLEQRFNEISTQLEQDAKKALQDAWERSKQVGQQSDNMSKIAQQAR